MAYEEWKLYERCQINSFLNHINLDQSTLFAQNFLIYSRRFFSLTQGKPAIMSAALSRITDPMTFIFNHFYQIISQ